MTLVSRTITIQGRGSAAAQSVGKVQSARSSEENRSARCVRRAAGSGAHGQRAFRIARNFASAAQAPVSGAYPELGPQTVVNVADGKRRHNSTSEDALQAVTATLAAGEGATAGTKRLRSRGAVWFGS